MGNIENEEVVHDVEAVKETKVWVCCPVCGNKLFMGKSFEAINIKCHCGTFIEANARHLKLMINVESLKLKN